MITQANRTHFEVNRLNDRISEFKRFLTSAQNRFRLLNSKESIAKATKTINAYNSAISRLTIERNNLIKTQSNE